MARQLLGTTLVRASVLPLLFALAPAACSYKPGSFSHYPLEFVGKRTRVGCIDLAIQRRADAVLAGTVIAYEFGNACDREATIDLANVRILAQTFDGERFELRPYDPESELRPLKIDARSSGAEAIEYPSDKPLAEVCVDAASVAQVATPEWLCFEADPPPQLAERSE